MPIRAQNQLFAARKRMRITRCRNAKGFPANAFARRRQIQRVRMRSSAKHDFKICCQFLGTGKRLNISNGKAQFARDIFGPIVKELIRA